MRRRLGQTCPLSSTLQALSDSRCAGGRSRHPWVFVSILRSLVVMRLLVALCSGCAETACVGSLALHAIRKIDTAHLPRLVQGPDAGSFSHEAGFDAWMTGAPLRLSCHHVLLAPKDHVRCEFGSGSCYAGAGRNCGESCARGRAPGEVEVGGDGWGWDEHSSPGQG